MFPIRSEGRGLSVMRTLDPAVLNELSAMVGERGAAIAAEVAHTWFAEAPDHLAVLAPDSAADEDEILAAAHALKSSSRLVGAMALGAAAEHLECAAKAGDLDSVVAERADVAVMFERVKAELLARHPASSLDPAGAEE